MFSWESKKIFITGADGFIGGWLAKELLHKKANVFVLVRDIKAAATYKLLGLEKHLTVIQGDVVDFNMLSRVINEYSVDTCFHLAAQALVGIASRGPISTFETNIKGTWNLLEACRHSKTMQRIVIASSDKAYGVQKDLPYREESPLLGKFPYDASKVCAEIIARSYFSSYKLPVAITRNANTYGPGDLNFSRIIPDAIRHILQNKEFVLRGDGTSERDFMYIKDAVDAYLILAENISRHEVNGEAFNFGTVRPISINDLFSLIATVCGKPHYKPALKGKTIHEIDRQYLAIDKAKKILNWAPNFTLEEGLKETVAWYKKHIELFTL